ncbi:hypothetical protein JTB14_017064 [Gonioctena quinquepunctata]|nr:hypothetical protein JTB14_017064 [Gonioctena quinquepunctata]
METPDTVSQTWTPFQRKQVSEIFEKFIHEKRIPPLAKIQEELVLNECELDKSISKIQAWIRAEIRRKSLTKTGERGWSPEGQATLRQYFPNYYKLTQKNKVKTYPCSFEINKAIETIPLLKNKTEALIRSKLQNEFTHLLQKFMGHKDSDEEDTLSDFSESSDQL